nr:MAG TPA: hypothetical protein [Crassvirales sp.]
MENKQLESEDLLMNKKEELIWRVIDNVISCCAITRIDGAKSITREDVVGKSREENVVLTRCLVVEQKRIAGIENEVAGMKGDIAKILAAVTKN